MEVIVSLKFTTPCLGNVRRPECDLMQRSGDGKVIFLPTWWRSAFAQAAKAVNRYHRYVDRIHAALEVDGDVTRIKRRYGRRPGDFKFHEGFDVGTVVKVRFAVPNDLSVEQFTELLEALGDYIGISPYGWKKGDYGHFKVRDVSRVAAGAPAKGGEHSAGDSGG
jgi:hypothetical protein